MLTVRLGRGLCKTLSQQLSLRRIRDSGQQRTIRGFKLVIDQQASNRRFNLKLGGLRTLVSQLGLEPLCFAHLLTLTRRLGILKLLQLLLSVLASSTFSF